MADRPSIVVIVAHDLGKHLACYGHQTVSTPHLDAFAKESAVFENAFCTAPQCSPSRAAIFTGLCPHQTGVMGLTHGNFAWDFKPGIRHIAELLREAGYFTGIAGVQHERRHPASTGYEWGSPADIPAEEVAEQAESFFKNAKQLGRPYYLQVGFFEPHRPFDFGGAQPDDSRGVEVPPFLVDDQPAKKEFVAFQGLIKQLDAGFEKLLAALDKHGDPENTLVIFTTDHGIPFPRAKCSLYDPGIEVALLARWPSQGWGGRYRQLVSHMDIFPTLCDTASLNVETPLLGKSWLTEDGKFSPNGHEFIFSEMTYHAYYDPLRSVRSESHKLIASFSSAPSFMDPSQSWQRNTITRIPERPSHSQHVPLELYDLANDPWERKNLADNIEHKEILINLANKLRHRMEVTGDPLLSGPVASPMHLRTSDLLCNLTNGN